ncbi:hypothetical protein EVAR_7725_1 [Eumeta japonica]|uniref:Uncharacterized protein n=1 Tax=Eumeta variegata TaxID=151549 RepID=A0A4C1TM25_EUMVA|nr:hypothetical protein EVAR_7725_1 [Eumeta japonica]
MIRDALCLISLRHALLSDVKNGDQIQPISQEILSTPIQLAKQENLTEEDIQLDSKCMEHVETYVAAHSTMKSQQELALQGFREMYQQLIELSRGLKKAHGTA